MKKLTEKKVYRLVLIGALILFILTNIFFSLASARWTLRLDTTENKLYELSTTTLDVLSGLESDTKVYVLENEADFPAVLRELLSRYARTSDKLSIISFTTGGQPLHKRIPNDALHSICGSREASFLSEVTFRFPIGLRRYS